MDLNLLRVFNAVMLERNVTQAASSLCMTQPAVSNAINRLRNVLDDQLFLKVHGGVVPTPRAQAIWPPIRDALRSIEHTIGTQEFDAAEGHATYRIAASDYVTEHLIRPLLPSLLQAAPRIELHFKPHRIRDAVALLEKGEIDFAAGVLASFSSHIRVVPMDTLQYFGVLRTDHPIGDRPSASQFLNAKHVSVSLSGGPSLIDIELAERGLKRQISMVINQFGLLPWIVAETDLVAVVPAKVVLQSQYRSRLRLIELPFPIQPRIVSLIWHARSDESSEHRWLREQLLRNTADALTAQV